MPYGRDAGMTQTAADDLAARVREALGLPTTVTRDGHYFVVAVDTTTETVRLYDEVDWEWLQGQH